MAEDSTGPRPGSNFLENSSFWCHAVIFLFAVISFLPEFFYYSFGFDSIAHLSFNLGFSEALRAGALYPRWMRDINQGDGGPTFIFYGPVFSYVAALFSWKLNVLTSVKIAAFLFWWGAGAGMFVCAREWLSRPASLLAALVYLVLPHHLFGLYRSTTLAELAQYVWAPLILRRFARLPHSGSQGVFFLALCLAGAMLTHLVTALVLLYFLAGAGVILLFRDRPTAWKLLSATLWSLGLGAIYLLPAMAERPFINPFELESQWNYRNKLAAYVTQPWSSALAIGDVAFLAVLAYAALKTADGSLHDRTNRRVQLWLLLSAAIALFMTLPISAFVWRLPGLSYVMFPNRWLLVLCVAAGLVAGIQFERGIPPGTMWRIALLLSFTWILVLSGIQWRSRAILVLRRGPDWRQTEAILESARYRTEMTAPPIWVPNIQQRFAFDAPSSPAGPPVELLNGKGSARVEDWSPNARRIRLDLETPALVELRTFYFPGWGCTLDGAETPLEISAKGRLQVAAPIRSHELVCRFRNTADRTAGAMVSLVSLLAAVAVFVPGALPRGGKK